jgi:hypothetical protein
MTDEELVKALRAFADDGYADLSIAAADRIEALTAKLAEAEKEIAAHKGKAEVHSEARTYWSDYEEYCAMAEIKGEKP